MKPALTESQIYKLSIEELDVLIPRSLELSQRLQNELSLEYRINSNGERMTGREFHDWRCRCKTAHLHRLTEYRRLRDARHRLYQSARENPARLLTDALDVLRNIEDLTAEELLVCHRIETWLTAMNHYDLAKSGVVAPTPD